jgi:Leucine-rich repeat (LRR) protein
MSLSCTYFEETVMNETFYVCLIDEQFVPPVSVLDIIGEHSVGKTGKDVKEVKFRDCEVSKVPQRLTKLFPSMTNLTIWSSNLQSVTKNDLVEYQLLKKIFFIHNELEFLPGDLFEGFKNLEVISFMGNDLRIIEPNIFDGLKKLKHVNLSKNRNFTKYFSKYLEYIDRNASLAELKNEVNQVICKNFQLYKNIIQKEAEKQQTLFIDINKFVMDDSFKDFNIQIGDQIFPVHKFILAARSPTIAEIIKNNPEVENLNLFDMPVEIFEKVLKYIYTDEYPTVDGLDLLRLYAAAGRLKITELKNFAASQILRTLNADNSIEVLKLSNKYEHEELRENSFDEIKKKFPKIPFKDKWTHEPETVQMIIDKFMEKEEAKRLLDQEFEEIRMNC